MFQHQIESGTAWNFGPNSEHIITVQEVANKVFKVLGSGKLKIDKSEKNPHEAGLLQLNCDKANSELGWKPTWSGEKAIKKTAEWYRDAEMGLSIEKVTNNQIKEFFNEK